MTRHIILLIILTRKYSHVCEDFSHDLSSDYTTFELCVTNYLFGLVKMKLCRSRDLKEFSDLEHVYMRREVNSNWFEISLRGKISLWCKVTSLFAST